MGPSLGLARIQPDQTFVPGLSASGFSVSGPEPQHRFTLAAASRLALEVETAGAVELGGRLGRVVSEGAYREPSVSWVVPL